MDTTRVHLGYPVNRGVEYQETIHMNETNNYTVEFSDGEGAILSTIHTADMTYDEVDNAAFELMASSTTITEYHIIKSHPR